jgi:hypothetical protein
MVTLLTLLALTGLTVPDRDPDIFFSKSQTSDARLVSVEVWFDSPFAPAYLMRRTVSYRPDLKLPGQTVDWATEKSCPQALAVFKRIRDISMPQIIVSRIAPDDDATATHVRADGANYRLNVEAYYPLEAGKVDLHFGSGTPVASWIDESFYEFAPCWQER